MLDANCPCLKFETFVSAMLSTCTAVMTWGNNTLELWIIMQRFIAYLGICNWIVMGHLCLLLHNCCCSCSYITSSPYVYNCVSCGHEVQTNMWEEVEVSCLNQENLHKYCNAYRCAVLCTHTLS